MGFKSFYKYLFVLLVLLFGVIGCGGGGGDGDGSTSLMPTSRPSSVNDSSSDDTSSDDISLVVGWGTAPETTNLLSSRDDAREYLIKSSMVSDNFNNKMKEYRQTMSAKESLQKSINDLKSISDVVAVSYSPKLLLIYLKKGNPITMFLDAEYRLPSKNSNSLKIEKSDFDYLQKVSPTGKNKALILAGYQSDFDKDLCSIKKSFEDAGYSVDFLVDKTMCGVDKTVFNENIIDYINSFDKYDAIYIDTHGGIDKKTGWNVFSTGINSKNNTSPKLLDFVQLDSVSFGNHGKLLISPKYIESTYKNKKLSNSYIHIDACHTGEALNNGVYPFAEAFLSNGASIYLSYNNTIQTSVQTKNFTIPFLQNLSKTDISIDEARDGLTQHWTVKEREDCSLLFFGCQITEEEGVDVVIRKSQAVQNDEEGFVLNSGIKLIARAGDDITLIQGTIAILDASKSEGATTYEWREYGKGVLSHDKTFVIPRDFSVGEHIITLRVWNKNLNVEKYDNVVVTVLEPINLKALSTPFLTVSSTTDTVSLSWSKVENASRYMICQSTSKIPDGSKCKAYGGELFDTTRLSVSIQDLKKDTTYYFRVQGVRNEDGGLWSEEKNIRLKTSGPTPQPTPRPTSRPTPRPTATPPVFTITLMNPSIITLELKKESNSIDITANYVANDGSAIDFSYLKITNPLGKIYSYKYDTIPNYKDGWVSFSRNYNDNDIFEVSGNYRISVQVENENGLLSGISEKTIYLDILKDTEVNINDFNYKTISVDEIAGTAYLHITSTISNEDSGYFYDNGSVKSLDSGTVENGYVTLNSGRHIIKVCATNGSDRKCSNEKVVIVAKKVEESLYKKLPLEAKSNGLSNDGINLIYGTTGGNIYRLNIHTKESTYLGDVNERVSGLYYVRGDNYIYYSSIPSGRVRAVSFSQEISQDIANLPFPDALDYYNGKLYLMTNNRSGILTILDTTGKKLGVLSTGLDGYNDIVGITHTNKYLYVLSEEGNVYQVNSHTGNTYKIFNNRGLFDKGGQTGLEAITILNNRIYVSYVNDSSVYLIDVDLSSYE